MADQEFLASFAVDIDEAGVSRLQKVLEDNRELADSLASSFAAASESLHSFYLKRIRLRYRLLITYRTSDQQGS